MGLKSENAQIYATDNAESTAMSGESMSDTGDGLTFKIDAAAKNVFDPSVTFTVKSNGSTVAASTYTLSYLSGEVTFDSSQTGNTITIDGSYLPKHVLLKGFEVDMTLSQALLDITQFQDDAPRMTKGLKSFEGSFGSYEVLEKNIDSTGTDDGPSLDDILLADQNTAGVNQNFVFRYEPNDDAGTMVSAFVELSEGDLSGSSGDVQTRSWSMNVDNKSSAMATQPDVNVEISY